MTLLAFPPTTTCAPYKRLYDPARWIHLATSFRATLFALHALPPLPLLCLSLHTGLGSLKLPACYSPPDQGEHNPDCPLCDGDGNSGLGALAQGKAVPFSHHINSTMVCKVTGKVMESEPLALPNGRVYSKEVRRAQVVVLLLRLERLAQALEALAIKGDGSVTCPRTRDTFEFSTTRKVFIS
jgi:macrophage erythroblast attacher